MAPREPENNSYAKFWGDKQRALWYVMIFSGVVNSTTSTTTNYITGTANFLLKNFLKVLS